MLRLTGTVAYCTLAIAALAACGAAKAPVAGFAERTIAVGAVERRFLLYAPPGESAAESSTSGLRPLVLVLHGGGGTAQQIARDVGPAFLAHAASERVYVVFPDAIGRIWDFGAGQTSEGQRERTDDRAFFGALLDTLTRDYPVDPQRVFATGISRGGQASFFVACTFPGRIRAIAPVAMSLPRFMQEACTEGPPVGLTVLNGTDDPLVPYTGGSIVVLGRERDEVLSTDETIALWRARNGCAEGAAPAEVIDRADDGMRVEKSAWRDCTGAPVVLYRIVGGGHTWPSAPTRLPARVVGGTTLDIDGVEEIWGFFRGFAPQ